MLRNSSDINFLRVPNLAAGDAIARPRRLVLADGLLLSVHVDLPRHELVYALDRYLDALPMSSFTEHGFTMPISINWTAPNEVCNGVPWNPIGACLPDLPSAAMSTYVYRKDGQWAVRFEGRDPMSSLDRPPAIMPVLQAHFLHSKRSEGFNLPDMRQSGYLQDLQSDSPDSLAILESASLCSLLTLTHAVGPSFWGVWRWRRGERNPAAGFTEAGIFLFKGSPFDYLYWRQHGAMR